MDVREQGRQPQQTIMRPIADWERPYLERMGQRLRELRRLSGLTQEQLGRAARLHATSVRNIEAGRRRTRRSTLCRLVAGLGVRACDVERYVDELAALAGPALAEESPWQTREPMHGGSSSEFGW